MAGVPLRLLYIAGNAVDAARAERVLTEHGVDYTLRLEPFMSVSPVWTGERPGLFVYVPTAVHRSCREILERHGLTDTVDEEELSSESH